MSKEKPSPEAVASFVMAKSQACRVEAYLTRARRFEKLTDSELGEKYVEGMREWASDPTNPDRRLLSDDVHAEYDLRGSELPSGVATAEVEAIVAAATAAYEQMSDEQKTEIEAENAGRIRERKKERALAGPERRVSALGCRATFLVGTDAERSMHLKLPKQLPLAELEHRLSSVPGGPTKGYVWRELVAAFWRGDLHAANWTREQLREKANLGALSFESIATQVARRGAYPEGFTKHFLDNLLLNTAEAIRSLEDKSTDVDRTREALVSSTAQQRAGIDQVVEFLLGYADGTKCECDCLEAAKRHFAPLSIPDKNVWRHAWRRLPANQKLSRGAKPPA